MTTSAPACTVCELHAESIFKVDGMDCREEVAMIERRFKHLAGLEAFTVDLVGQRLHVTHDAARLSTAAIAAAIADAGMRAWLEHEEPLAFDTSAERRRRRLLAASGVAFAAGLATAWLPAPSWLAPAFYAASMIASGAVTARKAWHAVRLRTADINVLMFVAAAGAVALGQWSEGAAVVFLFAIAQALEALTLERARIAVRALVDLAPAEALVREGVTERVVAVDLVPIGATIVVRPGEKVPLDGVVVSGSSSVNQASVTGESMPVDKAPGGEVFAGSINGRAALDVRVTRLVRDTTLARIVHLVERAQAARAPAQTLVERFARVYTPAVIGLAALAALAGPLVLGDGWRPWTYRALVLLVVSCPCALVISTPVSVVAALAAAARKGVLIKGGIFLERAAGVRCVAFDKTGTLTHGLPDVLGVVGLNGVSEADVVAMAASVERRATHPIARAIIDYADRSGVVVPAGVDVIVLAGLGAEGLVGARHVVLGNPRLFETRGLGSPALRAHVDAATAAGRTPVCVARDGEAVGVIALADRPRETSRDVVQLLRDQGIRSIVMLTGDNAETARLMAAHVGIDDVRANLMPEDKVTAVEALRREFGSVAMVGDGVNDAPALAAADVGMAMGAAGSDLALETADIALMSDELQKIPYALRLSRAAVRNIRVNLAIALVLKAAFVVAALTNVATLWMAVLADTGASIIVVANALRLLRAD